MTYILAYFLLCAFISWWLYTFVFMLDYLQLCLVILSHLLKCPENARNASLGFELANLGRDLLILDFSCTWYLVI